MKKILGILTLLGTLLLSSCDFRFPQNSDSQVDQSQDVENFETPSWYHPTSGDFSYTNNRAKKALDSQVITHNTLKELHENGYPTVTFNSLGNQNLLVIPVNFKNGRTCQSNSKGCARLKSDIERSFFGETEATGYESVSSFYYKSSYGYLNIQGLVTDWFDSSYSLSMLANAYLNDDIIDPTYLVIREAVAWFKNTYPDLVSSFDQNHDGFIDALWIVHSENYEISNSEYDDLLWAYTYWDLGNSNVGSVKSPTANVYSWASIEFMYDGGYKLPDAHTYIHETGHLLGLDDYYSYDQDDAPCGAIDMMDANIIDHNPFSKLLLGWVEPRIVQKEQEYQLAPFENEGDFLIIPSGQFNGSPFDEYLIIEYYTPTNLNALDSKAPYLGNGIKGYSKPGIRVFHVDSRLGLFRYNYALNGYLFSGYTENIEVDSRYLTYYTNIAHSNTLSESIDRCKLLTLMESSGRYTLNRGDGCASDDSLFYKLDNFGKTVYRDFTFNDGQKLLFDFVITDINDDYATLNVSNKI